MYGYEWTGQNGIYRLSVNSKIEKEIRPVFKEELDYFGFNEHWTYPDTDAPLLWAEGIRRYILNGTCTYVIHPEKNFGELIINLMGQGIINFLPQDDILYF